MIESGDNAVREQQAAYATAGATQHHALVRELWAVAGQSDRFHVQRIAERSGLPVKWLSEPPRINGERGMDKLMEERTQEPKETPQVWKAVGLEGKRLHCNYTG